MKKLLIILAILAGLGLVGVAVMSFFLGNVVAAGVNRFGPNITQTKVTLASATISPLTGSGALHGLVVGNPKGWSNASLCSLGKIHLSVKPFSIFGDHIVIEEIDVEEPEFNYETKVVASNVADLLKNIEQVTGGSDAAKATAKNGQPIKFEVKKFRLHNGWVRLGVGPAAMKLPMPPLALDNLGTSKGGITSDQLAYAIMRSVTPNVIAATTEAIGKLSGTAGAATAEGVKQIGAGIKGLFGGDKKSP
jgi:hypothetical protein